MDSRARFRIAASGLAGQTVKLESMAGHTVARHVQLFYHERPNRPLIPGDDEYDGHRRYFMDRQKIRR